MCGIAGVRRFGNDPITGEEIAILLCSLEHRGTHATGVALVDPDGIHVLKAPIPAWRFTKSPDFDNFLQAYLTPETETAILHTRFATTGNPEDNENNHPMYDGETAIVHNGMISNHQSLFVSNPAYKRSCETDSDIIRATLTEHGFNEKGLRELCKMSGSAAIACVSTKFPHKLLLARSGSPLVYGFSENGSKLYWASEAQAILHAARPWHNVRGAWVQSARPVIQIGTMPDNSAWLFGQEAIELHHEFRVCNWQYRTPDYSKGRENYHTKTKGWKRELRRRAKKEKREAERTASVTDRRTSALFRPVFPAPATTSKPLSVDEAIASLKGAVIACPSCGKGSKNDNGTPWEKLQCPTCHARLG
jgi:asparagine synthetase B (glutamine-hydrolysing)